MLKSLLSIALVLLAASYAAANPSDFLSSLKASPNARLGLAFPGKDPRYYDLVADAGIGVVRIGVGWKWVEPQRGSFDFRSLDRRISGLDRRGLTPFVTFESNAAWAVQHGDKVKNGTPRDYAEWARFVERVVERYDGDGIDDGPRLKSPVRWYQAANEFLSPTNRSGGWADSTGTLIEYINTAHDAVKRANPDAIFVLGGIASMNVDVALVTLGKAEFHIQQRWGPNKKTEFQPGNRSMRDLASAMVHRLKAVLSATRYDFADVHLYGPETRDASRLAMMNELSGRPVLSSECGGPSLDYDGLYSGFAHFRSVLWRNLNVLANGAHFCTWFGLGEAITSTYGNSRVQLYGRDLEEKPGVLAYRLLANLLSPEAEVLRDGENRFEIRTIGGPIYIAVRQMGSAPLQSFNGVSKTAICVSADRKVSLDVITVSHDARNCPDQAVLLYGAGLAKLFDESK